MTRRTADPTPRGGSGRAGRIAVAVISLAIVLALVWVLFFPRTRGTEPARDGGATVVPTPQ